MKSIAIMGASGHCKVIAEIALQNGYDSIVFVDKNPSIEMLGEYLVADEDADLDIFIKAGYDFVVGIGDAKSEARFNRCLWKRAQISLLWFIQQHLSLLTVSLE